MASSEDFQRVYELYKKQGVPNGISIVNFCQQQGIVYSQFERWFKSGKKPSKASVHPIRIVDGDDQTPSAQESDEDKPSDLDSGGQKGTVLRFGITVRTNQGLSLVSSNTIVNALKIGAGMLAPILLKLKSRLLKVKSVLNIDETWIRVRIKALNDGTKLGHYYKKYVWALVNKPENVTYFFYDNDEDDSRGSRPIETFLGGFLGSIQSDGYVVYKHLAEVNPQCEFILCWAHVRNKFAMTFEANKDADADWFVRKIGELYKIEAECILRHLKPHEIKKRRSRDDVTRILASIYERAMELLNGKRKHYGEMMRKSLSYMVGGWEKLLNYRKDGRYTIDNMLVERAIRPFTIHRKNSLFFSSEEGVETALTFLTLIETCKNVGLNARDYIATTIKLLMDGNKNYDDLVPMAMAV